ncbi:MAG TPA: substrate-binding domain-containing protein [Candidatus Angelobacter sp.]|nr:substrate-binding domain-containing protein [Candidatus Angelobacter sp.]
MTESLFVIVMWALTAWGGVPHQERGLNASCSPAGVELSVAAPDELNSALAELARRFEQKTGNRISLTFTDSVSLLKQIGAGSDFDAAFLPEMEEARSLAASGTLTSPSITEYARDQMVLCIAPGVRIDPRPGNPLLLLTSKSIPHIAIAS